MKYIRCPKCEINFIEETAEICDVCARENNTFVTDIKFDINHKRRNIFMVFQGKNYYEELTKGYLSASYKNASGSTPFHWEMLEIVQPGDIIFHGMMQVISAISVATSGCFASDTTRKNERVRRVNCRPTLISNTILTKMYEKEIIRTCSNFKYQPFDKNGNGNQGYLFDLNDELAGIFTRALIDKNPSLLIKIPELNELVDL